MYISKAQNFGFICHKIDVYFSVVKRLLMARQNSQIHYSSREFSLRLNSINCRYSMRKMPWANPTIVGFDTDSNFPIHLSIILRELCAPHGGPSQRWLLPTEQFVFWQQSWYEVQFGKEKVEDDDVCRYYRIAGRYVFEFSWCSLPCHVLIRNRLLFLLLLILRRGGGLESCPQRGSEAR